MWCFPDISSHCCDVFLKLKKQSVKLQTFQYSKSNLLNCFSQNKATTHKLKLRFNKLSNHPRKVQICNVSITIEVVRVITMNLFTFLIVRLSTYFFVLSRWVFLKLKQWNKIKNKINLRDVLNQFTFHEKWIRFCFKLEIALTLIIPCFTLEHELKLQTLGETRNKLNKLRPK